MKVLNIILIICGLLLFYIGLQSDTLTLSTSSEFSSLRHQLETEDIDLRPNIEKVIDELSPYPIIR